MNRFNMYPGDYLRDTTELSLAEDGAFTRLLLWYYANERPIDAERAHAVTRANSEDDKRITHWVLSRFFRSETQGEKTVWVNDRAEREIAKARPRIEASRNNGQLGGRPTKSIAQAPISKPRRNPAGIPVGNPLGTPVANLGGNLDETHAGEGEGGASPGVTGASPRVLSQSRIPVSAKEAKEAADEFERGSVAPVVSEEPLTPLEKSEPAPPDPLLPVIDGFVALRAHYGNQRKPVRSLMAKLRTHARARLAEGFTVPDLVAALKAFESDDWEERARHLDPSKLLRVSNIERMLSPKVKKNGLAEVPKGGQPNAEKRFDFTQFTKGAAQ